MDKVPTYPAGLRPPKMMKNLIFMRGPEPVHHSLIHQQYGIVVSPHGIIIRIRVPIQNLNVLLCHTSHAPLGIRTRKIKIGSL